MKFMETAKIGFCHGLELKMKISSTGIVRVEKPGKSLEPVWDMFLNLCSHSILCLHVLPIGCSQNDKELLKQIYENFIMSPNLESCEETASIRPLKGTAHTGWECPTLTVRMH